MPFAVVRNDITKMEVDAIVSACSSELRSDGGVSAAILKAAGEARLSAALKRIRHCPVGRAVTTRGFDLPARYIIHAVGPIWQGGANREEELLYACYRSALEQARGHFCRSVALPLISAGTFGFPKELALKTAHRAIDDFLQKYEMQVYLVVFDSAATLLSQQLFRDLSQFIDANYAEAQLYAERRNERSRAIQNQLEEQSRTELPLTDAGAFDWDTFDEMSPIDTCAFEESAQRSEALEEMSDAFSHTPEDGASSQPSVQPFFDAPMPAAQMERPKKSPLFPAGRSAPFGNRSLADVMNHLDDSFSRMLFRLIDERGLTDVQVYKRANLDRKLFSKLRKESYSPSKQTVLALAIALRLSLDETKDLLARAGFALSRSNKADVIVEYFLSCGIYDIYTINEALFFYEQKLLGA